MEDIAQFIDWLSKAFPVVAVISGLLGFYYREKIKSILARSMAREVETLKNQFAREALQLSANLQRDIESYKVSLIADAERAKAKQEVRTSIALKIAEKRFNAISRMHDAHMGLDTDISALVCIEQSEDSAALTIFGEKRTDILAKLGNYSDAMIAASLFMPIETQQLLSRHRQLMMETFKLRSRIQDAAISRDDEKIKQLFDAAIKVEQSLLQMIQQMERFDADA